MTNAEKKALYHYIQRLTLADIETITKDEKSALLVHSGLNKILRFIFAQMIQKEEGVD